MVRSLSQTNEHFGDRFGFTGREWDSQLELYYYRARFYDPIAGRFISQDPIRFAAGDTNLYRYVGNNPLDFTDPSGNLAITECMVVQFASAALNTFCSGIQMALKGEFNGKSFGEAANMTANQVIFGGQFSDKGADGNQLSPAGSQIVHKAVERTMHFLNVASTILPGGAGIAMQLVLKAISISVTAKAVADFVANPHLFQIMGLAETWVRGAYAVAKNPGATFQQAVDGFNQMPATQQAMIMSEIACGAANMALMVYSASARCFVAGTPVVVEIVTPTNVNITTNDNDAERGSFQINAFDLIAGTAIIGAILIYHQKTKMEEREATNE